MLETSPWLVESETDDERKKRLRKMRNLRLAAIMRIFGLIANPLPMPALPPPPPPAVEVDKRKKGGGQGGSPEGGPDPESSVLNRLGQLAATTPNGAEAEAYVGALPTLAAALMPSATPALVGATPEMVTGLSTAARVLRQRQSTRDLVNYLPEVARRTALRVNRHAAAGRPVPPEVCARMLADTAVRVLSDAVLEADTRTRTQAAPSALGRVAEARRILAMMRPPRWNRYGRTTAPIDPRLLRLAMEVRATQAGVSSAAFRAVNVATARVRVDGKVRYLSTGNTPGGGAHAEQWIDAQIHALSRGGRRVALEQLYTERIPCRRTCGPFLRGRYPYAGIYYTTAATGGARAGELRRAYGLGR